MGAKQSKSTAQVQPSETVEAPDSRGDDSEWCFLPPYVTNPSSIVDTNGNEKDCSPSQVEFVAPPSPYTSNNSHSQVSLFPNGGNRVSLRTIEVIECVTNSPVLDSEGTDMLPVEPVVDSRVPALAQINCTNNVLPAQQQQSSNNTCTCLTEKIEDVVSSCANVPLTNESCQQIEDVVSSCANVPLTNESCQQIEDVVSSCANVPLTNESCQQIEDVVSSCANVPLTNESCQQIEDIVSSCANVPLTNESCQQIEDVVSSCANVPLTNESCQQIEDIVSSCANVPLTNESCQQIEDVVSSCANVLLTNESCQQSGTGSSDDVTEQTSLNTRHNTTLPNALILGESDLEHTKDSSANTILQTVKLNTHFPDKVCESNYTMLTDSICPDVIQEETDFRNDPKVVVNSVRYTEQLTESASVEEVTESIDCENFVAFRSSKQLPECLRSEQLNESSTSEKSIPHCEHLSECLISEQLPPNYEQITECPRSEQLNESATSEKLTPHYEQLPECPRPEQLTKSSTSEQLAESSAFIQFTEPPRVSEPLPEALEFNFEHFSNKMDKPNSLMASQNSNAKSQTINLPSISEFQVTNLSDARREQPDVAIPEIEVEKFKAETSFSQEDDEEIYGSEASDESECLNEAHSYTQNIMNSTNIHITKGNDVHIGDKIYLDRSLSQDVVRSALEELNQDEDRLIRDFRKEARATLIAKYKTPAFCQVTIPLECKKIHVDKCLPLSLDEVDIFAEHHLVKERVKSLTNLAELLKEKVSRLLIEGPTGYGKSTFFMQITYDWASKKQSAFASFKLCFLIRGRDVKGSLVQTMLHQLRGTRDDLGDEEDLLRRTLRQLKDRVLILVDGYDELTKTARKEIDYLINLSYFPSAVVIVASRPHKCNQIQMNFQKRLILQGFSFAQIEEYSSAFSKGTIQKVVNVLRGKVHILQHLWRSPLLLYFFCCVAEEQLELQINPSITALFKSALLKALRRNQINCHKLQDVSCLVKFGKLCVQRLNADKVTFSESELSSCCKNRPCKTLLGLGFVSLEYDWNGNTTSKQCYAVAHKTILEFLAALYMSTVDDDDFSGFLCTFLARDNGFQSLLPQFLIGLSADRTVSVLEQLPRSLLCPQIFTLCLLMNEIVQIENPSFLLQYLPYSLCLNLNEGFVLVNNIHSSTSHYCIASDVTVSSMDDIQIGDQQLWKPSLLDLLSEKDLPTRELHLELNPNNHSEIHLATDICNALCLHSKITAVSITAEKLTEVLSDLLSSLRRSKNLQHLLLNLETLEGCERFFDNSSGNKFANLQSLEIVYPKKFQLSDLQLDKLCELVHTSSMLSRLTIQQVSSFQSLQTLTSMIMVTTRLHHFGMILDTSAMIQPKKKQKQEHLSSIPKTVRDQLAKTCLNSFATVLAGCSSFLTTLDLSHSCLKREDVAGLVSCVVQPECRLTSLLLPNCVSGKNLPLDIDLSALVPQNKKWDQLDLSGWQISYEELMSFGTISKLIALDATLTCVSNSENSNFVGKSIVDIFSIQELHCNLDQAFLSQNAFLSPTSHLIHLNVCCPPSQQERSDLPKFLDSLRRLSKLKYLDLKCRVEDLVSDPDFDSWSSYVDRCSLTNLHLEVVYSDSCMYDYNERRIFKMAQIALQKAPQLTAVTIVAMDVPYSSFWKTNLPSFMKYVVVGFNKHCLKSLTLIQTQDQWKEFLLHLELWEVKNKYKVDVNFGYQYGKDKGTMDITLCPKKTLLV